MKLLLTLTLSALLAACGLVKDEKQETEFYDIGGLETGCKLSGDQFHNILSENISNEINCLESSLKQFADYVRRENPDYINRIELERFINRFFPEDAADIVKVLRPAFKVLSVLLKDPGDNLAVNNLPLVAQILKTINQQGRGLSDILKVVIEKAPADGVETDEQRKARLKRNSERYWVHKSDLMRVGRSMAARLISIISLRENNNSSIDVPEILEELKVALELGDDFDTETITSFLFVKKLIIGGDLNILKDVEVASLLGKAPDLMSVALDAMFMSERPKAPGGDSVADIDTSRFLMDLVKRARRMFFAWNNPNEEILKFDNLTKVLEMVMEDVDWVRASDSLLNFKEKIIGGDARSYSFNDFDRLMNMLLEATEISFFNYITYHHFSHVMQSESPVVGIQKPNLDEYSQFSERRVNEMWTNFAFIAKNYHFFLDRDGYSTVAFKIKRHSYGFNLLSLARWGLQKFFVAYGRIVTSTSSGEFVLDLEDTRLITSHYKGVLEELELWPDDLERLLSELRLGSDLFRMNSNGDNYIQLDEVNELVTVMITTSKMKNDVMGRLQLRCDNQSSNPEKPTFDLDCFHEHFFDVLFRELDHHTRMPNMHKFVLTQTQEQLVEFLIAVEVKGRIINDPSLPIDATDVGRILTNMFNYETLYKRFDGDQNGIFKGEELDGIYQVVEFVIASADDSLKPGAGLTKSAFLYVVKKEKLPKGLPLILFHINPLAKIGIEANRVTIARVLGLF
jgi:hypothetical protein